MVPISLQFVLYNEPSANEQQAASPDVDMSKGVSSVRVSF